LDHVVARNYGYLAQIPEHCYAVAFEFVVVVGPAEIEHEAVAELAGVVAEKADLATVGELVEADIAAGHVEAAAVVAALDTGVAAESGLDIVAAGREADRAVAAVLAVDTLVAARYYLDDLPSVAAAVSVLYTVAAEDVASVDAGLDIVADTALGTAK